MMSKKTAIILILVVFLGALGALVYFYFSLNNHPAVTSKPASTTVDVYDQFGIRPVEDNPFSATSSQEITIEPQTQPVSLDKLRQITQDPVSGYSVIEDLKNKQTDIHYILRANGNIYESYTDSLESKRLSITTIPKVYESNWLPDGKRLIIRYLRGNTEDIDTFSVKINPATTTLNTFEGGVDGNHLVQNINGLAINPAGDKIFYLTNNLVGANGYIDKPDGLSGKLLLKTPLTEWTVSWPKEETIALNTAPAANIAGYLYFVNSKTGDFTHILGGINGLTTKTNKTATEVLYSDSTGAAPKLYLYDVKSGGVKTLPWNTLPEKCLWSEADSKIVYCAVPKSFPEGDYPDAWYQGLVNFTDDIWMINTDTMASTLVMDLEKETNNDLDITDLKMDSKGNFLFFVNKTDLTLWSLNLK